VSAALSDAVTALRETADALARMTVSPPSEPEAPDTTPPAPATEEDERELYLRHLRTRGSLMDVDEGADLSALPPSVTHVMYPDGRVRRVGYR
jgi:hypothetical protein